MGQFCDEFFAELEKRAAGGDVMGVFDLASETLKYESRLLLNSLAEKLQGIPEPENQVMRFGLEFLKATLSGHDVAATLGDFVETILQEIQAAWPESKQHLVQVVRKLTLEG